MSTFSNEILPKWLHTQTFVQSRAVAQKRSQGSLKEQAKCQMMVPVEQNYKFVNALVKQQTIQLLASYRAMRSHLGITPGVMLGCLIWQCCGFETVNATSQFWHARVTESVVGGLKVDSVVCIFNNSMCPQTIQRRMTIQKE